MIRPSRALPWLLCIVLLVFSAAVYEGLPDRLPTAVDVNGRVTGATAKSMWAWLLLPGIATLSVLLIEVVRRQLPARPELFNFPGKDDLLTLPRELHPPVIAKMQRMLDITSAATMLVLSGAQVMLWHVAHGGNGSVGTIVLLLSGVVITPLVFVLLHGVTNEVEAAKRQWESRRNPLAP